MSKRDMLVVVTCDIVLVIIKSKQQLCLPSPPAKSVKSLPWNNAACDHKYHALLPHVSLRQYLEKRVAGLVKDVDVLSKSAEKFSLTASQPKPLASF